MLSCVVTQSSLLENEVYLTDFLINDGRDTIGSLKCVILVQPTTENIDKIVQELREPKYSEYHIYFCGFLKNARLERLAEADECELVKSVQEIFCNFYVLSNNHVSLQLGNVIGEQINSWDHKKFSQCVDGLICLLLSLKKKPQIRFDKDSIMASKLAYEVHNFIVKNEDSLFDIRKTDASPILLILDRRFDMITPLLLQWTYEALVHDFFGIYNGRVNTLNNELIDFEDGKKHQTSADGKEFVLSSVINDEFYLQNMDSNFGDLGENVKKLVNSFQEKTKQQQTQLDNIPSMKKFIEEYPEYKKMSNYVAKHVTLAGEISKRVEAFNLMQISEFEQEIASQDFKFEMFLQLETILRKSEIHKSLKLRLALIFSLRFAANISKFNYLKFIDLVRSCDFEDQDISLIDFTLKFAVSDVDYSPTSSDSFCMARMRGRGKTELNNKDTINAYTRHVPPLIDLLDALIKGKLSFTNYPCFSGLSSSSSPTAITTTTNLERPQEIVIFFVNGTTYEEAHYIRKYNRLIPGISIILAGTSVVNARSLISTLNELRQKFK